MPAIVDAMLPCLDGLALIDRIGPWNRGAEFSFRAPAAWRTTGARVCRQAAMIT